MNLRSSPLSKFSNKRIDLGRCLGSWRYFTARKSKAHVFQGRSQKKIMTEAMSMKNMPEAIGPFFSWVFMVFMMSIKNKNERND